MFLFVINKLVGFVLFSDGNDKIVFLYDLVAVSVEYFVYFSSVV